MPNVASTDGALIAHDRRGAGPAVIVVTGAAQYRAIDQLTPRLLDLLAPCFDVVAFDRRGRGESTEVAPYAVAREVEDVAALIDLVGGRASLFGVSSGAVLALEAASALLGRVERLALYEPPLDPDRAERAMSTLGMAARVVGAFARSPSLGEAEGLRESLAHDYRLVGETMEEGPLPTRWARAAMPALVLDGAESWGFVGRGADWVAGALPEARRLTLLGQGHDYDPDVLAPVLAGFLSKGRGPDVFPPPS